MELFKSLAWCSPWTKSGKWIMLHSVSYRGNNGSIFGTETSSFTGAWKRRKKRRERRLGRAGDRYSQESCKERHLGMNPGAWAWHSSAVSYLLFWKSGEDQCLVFSCLHQPGLDPSKSWNSPGRDRIQISLRTWPSDQTKAFSHHHNQL